MNIKENDILPFCIRFIVCYFELTVGNEVH